jgi:hypothetical protein
MQAKYERKPEGCRQKPGNNATVTQGQAVRKAAGFAVQAESFRVINETKHGKQAAVLQGFFEFWCGTELF